MTTAAWIFLVASWAGVIGLTVFCLVRSFGGGAKAGPSKRS